MRRIGVGADVETENIHVDKGTIRFTETPGLGTALQPEFRKRSDVVRRISAAK